jgi:hypothetical protein
MRIVMGRFGYGAFENPPVFCVEQPYRPFGVGWGVIRNGLSCLFVCLFYLLYIIIIINKVKRKDPDAHTDRSRHTL